MRLSRTAILTIIALVFHVVGLVGIGVLHYPAVLALTPLHLLLMFLLLVLSFQKQLRRFAVWAAIVFVAGFAAEWVGVHKGWLFGNYAYAAALGWRWQQVPVIIGINWAIVVCGAVCMLSFFKVNKYVLVAGAATIATVYDYVLEPAAASLGYWQWTGYTIPLWNYACWWLLSAVFAALWNILKLKGNQFAVNLLLIQLAFFIALRLLY